VNCSLALDSQNKPQICYYNSSDSDGDLCIVRLNGTNGLKNLDFVGDVDVLLLSIRALRATTYSLSRHYQRLLKYVKWTGSDWVVQIVDSTGFVGAYSSIALNGANKLLRRHKL
jgi:hypothetical protein